MPTIEIQALDTLFFRDGKPFEMGEDNWAEGMFPPPPSVIYGALRSAYFAEHPSELVKANKKGDPTENLVVKNIYIKWDDKVYLPAPLDLVHDKNDDETYLFPLKLIEKSEKFYSNYPYKYIPYFEGEAITAQGAFIQDNVIKNYYLKNNNLEDGLTCNNINSFFSKEFKIGNAINNESGSTLKGKLYRVGMIRPQEEFNRELNEHINLKIIVEFEYLELPENGILKLGAENKAVKYKSIEYKLNLVLDDSVKSRHFRLITLSPSISKNGNVPDFDKDINIVSAFVGAKIQIGGWDIDHKEPKKMHQVIPAGSVYYLEFKQELTINDVYEKINKISDEKVNEGFGTFTISPLNINNLKVTI